MGVVYRATDTKLGRDVALKVLPPVFANDSERMALFKQEAHVLASLNHPHIASIYGLEEADGIHCLVLELVEGPTLAERIQEGAVSLEESLKISKQIAEALEAAHEKGVIHRDLKPANVKVTPEGMVKVLDFGLAKAIAEPASDPAGAVRRSGCACPGRLYRHHGTRHRDAFASGLEKVPAITIIDARNGIFLAHEASLILVSFLCMAHSLTRPPAMLKPEFPI